MRLNVRKRDVFCALRGALSRRRMSQGFASYKAYSVSLVIMY